MKRLQKLDLDIFKEFEKDRLENLAACVGGAEGNTRGGFDFQDPCTKRNKDPITHACEDAPSFPIDPIGNRPPSAIAID